MPYLERTDAELHALEVALESEAVGLGSARYERLRLQGEENTAPGRAALRTLIPALAQSIQEFIDDATSGKPSPNAGIAKFLAQIPAEDVAFATCRAALYSVTTGRGTRFTTVATALGRTLSRAAQADAIKAADPKAYAKLVTRIDRCPWPNKRHILLRRAGEKATVTTIAWTSEITPARIGARLLLMLEQSSGGGIFVSTVTRNGKSVNVLEIAPEVSLQLETGHRRSSLWAPQYLPMVVKPRPWATPTDGGYLDRSGMRLRMVNAAHVNRNYLAELRHTRMPVVYRAMNALQETPWRINTRVYEVLRATWDDNLPLGKLPSRELIPLPTAPWGEGAPPSDDALKAHVAALARTHDANHKLAAKRRAMVSKLWLAEKYLDVSRFYFPHVLDFRGRMYPTPAFVNPQADDSGRALLEFADGVALGEGGAYWLAVHGANSYGIDKVTFDERAAWVTENTDAILAAARDPLGNTMWSDADKPFAFLAFCFEWAALQAHVDSGEPADTFVSRIPVSWDGSCNGLQNFSAMLLDEVGGKATNLVPSERPSDIYQQVADVAAAMVERDAANGEVNAQYWRGKVTRSVAKRPTMTLPYGSGRYGFRSQILEMMEKHKLETGKQYLDGGDPFLCSVYISKVLFDALGQVVVAARSAMEWLRDVSSIAASDALPIYWTTPAGFSVMQEYRELTGTTVATDVGTRRIKMTLQLRGDKLDARRQAQGISPNFVHSLDASHLMLTVAKAADRGMLSFAMVHDSYGTHAGNAGALHMILREAFVEQYGGNVLQKLHDELKTQLPTKLTTKLPPPPATGTLDLALVLDSDYFFA